VVAQLPEQRRAAERQAGADQCDDQELDGSE
jgi:hypothetical protein